MTIGNMNRQVVIKRPVSTNTDGHVVESDSTFTNVWAEVKKRNRDYYADGVYVQERNASMRVWYNDTIQLSDKAVIDAVEYEITDIEPDTNQVFMTVRLRQV